MSSGHVFISYIRDDSDAVDRLARALTAGGLQVWRDTAEVWPGDNWRVKIRQAIADDALVVIACFSRRGLARSVSYQNEELTLAIEQMRLRPPGAPWLIPVRFDDCQVPDLELGGGITLRSLQWADLFGSRGPHDTARLVQVVQQILTRESHVASGPPEADPRSPQRTGTFETSPWGLFWLAAGDALRRHREIALRSLQVLIAGLAATFGSLAIYTPTTENASDVIVGFTTTFSALAVLLTVLDVYWIARRAGAQAQRRIWLLIAYLLPVLGLWILGFPALLILMLKRDRAIRMNAIQSFGISLVLLPQFILGSILHNYFVGSYAIGYAAFGAPLLFCLAQVIRRKQPYFIGLSSMALRLAYGVLSEFRSQPRSALNLPAEPSTAESHRSKFAKSGLWLAAVVVLGATPSLFFFHYLSADSGPSPVGYLMDPNSYGVQSVAFTPDGQFLATGDGNGNTYVWNIATRTIFSTLPDPANGASVESVAFSPNGNTLAVGDDDAYAYLWNVFPGQLTATPAIPHTYGVPSVEFAPNGKTVALADSNASTYIWDIATQKIIATLPDPSGQAVDSVAFDSSGKLLASGDFSGTTYVWDIATQKIIATLPDPGGYSSDSVAFRPGGTMLATGDDHGYTYLWNIARANTTAIFTDPEGDVDSVAFSQGGHFLATGDADGTTYLWNVATHRLIDTFSDPDARSVSSVAFSPGSATLATADWNGYTYLWHITLGKP